MHTHTHAAIELTREACKIDTQTATAECNHQRAINLVLSNPGHPHKDTHTTAVKLNVMHWCTNMSRTMGSAERLCYQVMLSNDIDIEPQLTAIVPVFHSCAGYVLLARKILVENSWVEPHTG